MLVPDYLCLPIPDDMPFSIGAMIDDCIGTPYRAIKRMRVNGSNTVFITGAGPIGAAAAVIVKFLNGRVIVVDPNEYRLEEARRNGADYVINPEKDDVLTRVRELTDNKGADIAIDCSGLAAAQIQCLEVVRSGGRVAFLGIRSETTPINIPLHCIIKELTIIGSWASTPQEHMEIVALLGRGMPIEKIITHQFGIDAAQTAFDTFFAGKAVKVVINLWES
jgi:propanol-preferring alcohol dehydrogenase